MRPSTDPPVGPIGDDDSGELPLEPDPIGEAFLAMLRGESPSDEAAVDKVEQAILAQLLAFGRPPIR